MLPSFSSECTLPIMVRNTIMSRGIFPWSVSKTMGRKIIVGLKSDNGSREMLLRFLNLVVQPGDTVLAVHVQEQSDDSFDPNTFYIHEDLCKSKKVDFEIKICAGKCYIAELSHQVRITFATILAVGCSNEWPKDWTVRKHLKALPPSCSLFIMNNAGRILFQRTGSSQLGSIGERSPKSSPQLTNKSIDQQTNPVLFQRLVMVEAKGCSHFTFQQLNNATDKFSENMLIVEGGRSRVYRAVLENGEGAAVKVVKTSHHSDQSFLREMEMLGGLRHDNIVQLLGYCYSKEMYAIIYNLMDSCLKNGLKQLKWSERMRVAVGLAKALEYLHSFSPPIIHGCVNSSNILLSEDRTPHLSDFGEAMLHSETNESAGKVHLIGTLLGHMAPEYMMYGKIDEKTDVYAYGVVLLELITGRQTSPVSNQDSIVAWARPMLTCGLAYLLIDQNLNGEYKQEEMERMIIVTRLCLLPSSSRRPTMKTILGLLEEQSQWLEMQKKREEGIGNGDETNSKDDSHSNDSQ